MMRQGIIGIILCSIVFLGLLQGCNDDDEKTDEIVVQETSLQFEGQGGSTSLTILTSSGVSVRSTEKWCKVEGYTTTTTSRVYTITAEPNPLQETRHAQVIVITKNSEKPIPVEQAASPRKEKEEPYTDKYAVREKLSTMQLIDEMGLGINLGNTLDATGDWINPSSISNYERAWGSPIITKEMIEGYAKAGYSSLRIPVSWSNMMLENYQIHPDLMARVETILNWTLDCGMVAVVNVHHENEWVKKVPTDSEAKKKFTAVWTQISQRLEKYGDHLLFEPMNEIGYDEIWSPWNGGQSDKAKAFGYVNELNQLFVDIVRGSGGNNAKRHLLVEVYNTGLEYAFDPLTKMPNDPAGRLAMTVHYYTPPLFAILGNGEVTDWGVGVPSWGTATEIKELNDNMDLLKRNCVDKGIPVIVGEYAASSQNRTKDVVRFYCVSVTEAVYSRGMCPMLWDTPGGQYNRTTCKFDDSLFLQQMMAIPTIYPRY